MAEPISIRQNALRSARSIQGIMFISILLDAFAGEQISRKSEAPGGVFIAAISVVAIFEIILAIYFRKRFVLASAEQLRDQPDDVGALKRWRAGIILVAVFCVSIGLYGMVLRSVGYTLSRCVPFYAVAALLLLIWWPRLDVA